MHANTAGTVARCLARRVLFCTAVDTFRGYQYAAQLRFDLTVLSRLQLDINSQTHQRNLRNITVVYSAVQCGRGASRG